jgi:hypothetical protein
MFIFNKVKVYIKMIGAVAGNYLNIGNTLSPPFYITPTTPPAPVPLQNTLWLHRTPFPSRGPNKPIDDYN